MRQSGPRAEHRRRVAARPASPELLAACVVGCGATHKATGPARPSATRLAGAVKRRARGLASRRIDHGTARRAAAGRGSCRHEALRRAARRADRRRHLDERRHPRDGDRCAARSGPLPAALHDAAAATLGGHAYVFGGGNGVAQLDQIVQAPGDAGRPAPAPSSDQAAPRSAAPRTSSAATPARAGSTRSSRSTRAAARASSPTCPTARALRGGDRGARTADRRRRLAARRHREPRRLRAGRPGRPRALVGRLPAPTTHAGGGRARRRRLRRRRSRRVARHARPTASSRSTSAPAASASQDACPSRRPTRRRRRSATAILVARRPHVGRDDRRDRLAACRRAPSTVTRTATRERLRGRHGRRAARRGAARAPARLRPEQPQQHRRRDRPADVQGRRPLRGRRAAAARHARRGT